MRLGWVIEVEGEKTKSCLKESTCTRHDLAWLNNLPLFVVNVGSAPSTGVSSSTIVLGVLGQVNQREVVGQLLV